MQQSRRRSSRFTLALLSGCAAAWAQVGFQEAPRTGRLYARDRATDSAKVAIAGTVARAGADYSELRIKVSRGGSALPVLTAPLAFTNGAAAFSVEYPIKAELAVYSFSIYAFGGGRETLLRSADSVVAGDVYIIQGQSNAEAHGFDNTVNTADRSPFIRVMGSSDPSPTAFDTTWRQGQGDGDMYTAANTGQWGLRLARLLLNEHKLPIAVFNGNHSGQPIAFFRRNDSKPDDASTNYGRLLRRMRAARLQDKVRAIFWVQGEGNATTSASEYMSSFGALSQTWKQDYAGVQKIYLFQLRNGCNNPLESMANILDAERRLARQGPGFGVMSMSAQAHDKVTDCHYPFPGGYALMGDNIHRLVERDLYGAPPADDVEPPTPLYVERSGSKELTLILSPLLDSLRMRAGAEKEFKLNGSAATVVSAQARGMIVRLTLSAAPDGITSLSFLGHAEIPPEAFATNRNGVGALLFHLMPVTPPAYRDSSAVTAVLRANGVAPDAGRVAARSPSGRVIGLNLPALGLATLPGDIGLLDSLRSLDLTGNRLAELPREIILLNLEPGSLKVDGNRLCAVPAAVSAWLDKAAGSGWKASQTPDGQKKCDGSVSLGRAVGADRKLALAWLGDRRILRIGEPGSLRDIRILGWNGSLVAEPAHGAPASDMSLPGLAPGVYFVLAMSPAGPVGGSFLILP